MRLAFTFLVGALLSIPAGALPGFPERLKVIHPELKVDCLTCHETKPPASDNVLPQGKRYYEEILESEAKKVVPKGQSVLGNRPPDFIVYGDTRNNPEVNTKLVREFCAEHPKAVFHTGDIVQRGHSPQQWAKALVEADCLIQAKLFYPACGNHEGRYCTKNVLRDKLGNHDHFYSTSVGGFTFLTLDSIDRSREQARWLASLPKGPLYIPLFHYPPYPTLAGHKGDKGVILEFLPEFKRLGVKLVFTGHNHGYDRAVVDGVQYVTSGGGGAPLYPCGEDKPYTKACLSGYSYVRCAIDGTAISCQAHRIGGDIVDSFSVDYHG
jgi:hypothetical protein